MSATISLIAAVAGNNVIGASGKIPWRLPSDFANFKRTTMGKPLIMGRHTFESIGRLLAGRFSIVVSARDDFHPEGVRVARDLPSAMSIARDIAGPDGEVMIGGGGEIYAATIGGADRLYISHVALAPDGDVTFPPIDPAIWQVTEEIDVPPDPRDTAKFAVKLYTRRNPSQR